jgi:ATP-dependent DNA helicase RecG
MEPGNPTQISDPLLASVQFAKGVGPARAPLFEKLGVHTLLDLLYLFPRDYRDQRDVVPIASLVDQEVGIVEGTVEYAKEKITRNGMCILEAAFGDGSGYVTVTWFRQPWLAEKIQAAERYRIVGKAVRDGGIWRMTNPRIVAAGEARSTLTPIYPLTEGLKSEQVAKVIAQALEKYAGLVPELLPAGWRRARQLLDIGSALQKIHAPDSPEELDAARCRIVYDELLPLQVALAIKRASQRRQDAPQIVTTDPIDRRIRRLFPFELTAEQNRVLGDITRDLAQGRPMNRLLQGDVGSGKTAVAIYAILSTIAAGFQAALMAPTEVLARQHYETLEGYLAQSRVRRLFLKGGMPAAEREEALRKLKTGEIDLVVGTHALVQKDVGFAKLGLVVIDEQHKFGVRQRSEFRKQSPSPHYLVMTATPIPRSLAMTWFGDLDISVLRSPPPGRQAILTYLVPAAERMKAYEFLEKQVRGGSQGLVVCPRIEASSDRPLESAVDRAAAMAEGSFRDLGVGLLHGQLEDDQRDHVLTRFRSRQINVLVSTVVVEVGIDIPSANVVLIENAETFGLSQLHQIRGRVGRGTERGICFLIDSSGGPTPNDRLIELSKTTDGFVIADMDARMRGVGEAIGTRQHGSAGLAVADLFRDAAIVRMAREDARQLIQEDPRLKNGEWQVLRRLTAR